MALPIKKLEFLTLDFPPIVGGISKYLFEIATHLPAQKVRVLAIAAFSDPDVDKLAQFEINRLKIPTKSDSFSTQLKFFAPFYLHALILKGDIEMLFCGQAHLSLMVPAWVLQKIRGTPVAIFSFGLDLLYPQTTIYKRLFNALLRSADIMFADSEKAADILAQLGVAQDKIHIVYPSVDLTLQELDQDAVNHLRNRLKLNEKRCLLSISRLVERKGHDKVLQSLPEVIRSVPNLHYIIGGTGPHEAALRTLVRELALENYVTFVGFVPDEQLSSYYACCDVFAMISREIPEKGDIEGFGIVYLEANLMGKPVVAGRSGGVPEAVLHQETGLLVDPHDETEVARALVQLLTDNELATRLGENGRQRALTKFTGSIAAEKVWHAAMDVI